MKDKNHMKTFATDQQLKYITCSIIAAPATFPLQTKTLHAFDKVKIDQIKTWSFDHGPEIEKVKCTFDSIFSEN